MPYARRVRLLSSNKVTSRKSKNLWTKGPEWNNAAHEDKEKYHHFTHPAPDYTNSYPHFNFNFNCLYYEIRQKKSKTLAKTDSSTRANLKFEFTMIWIPFSLLLMN